MMIPPRSNWRTLSSEIVHTNPYYVIKHDIVVRPDGSDGVYYVVEGRDSAFVVALDEHQSVVLVEVDRYTVGELSLEVPAGGLDGEEPLLAAMRELKEETGFVAQQWISLGTIHPENGIRRGNCHVYLATELTQTGLHAQREEGITRTVTVPFTTVFTMIKDGEIGDAESIAALTLAALKLGLFG